MCFRGQFLQNQTASKVSMNGVVSCLNDWKQLLLIRKSCIKSCCYALMWGTWKLWGEGGIFLTFRTVRTAKGKPKRCAFDSYFWKTNSLSPAESPLLKLLIMQINVILVTVVPVKLVKILLENSFPWCVIPCIFKAMCRDSSACSSNWF